MHIIGVIYLLKNGYSHNHEVIIPKDNYLNSNGVLIEKKEISRYLGMNGRNYQSDGLYIIKEYLDFGLNVIPGIDLRDILFP